MGRWIGGLSHLKVLINEELIVLMKECNTIFNSGYSSKWYKMDLMKIGKQRFYVFCTKFMMLVDYRSSKVSIPWLWKGRKKSWIFTGVLTFLLIVSEFHSTNYLKPMKIVRISCKLSSSLSPSRSQRMGNFELA